MVLINAYFFLFQYMFLLLVILLIEVGIGLLSFLYQKQVSEELDWNLNTTFITKYEVDKQQTEAIDYIQKRVSPHSSKLFGQISSH